MGQRNMEAVEFQRHVPQPLSLLHNIHCSSTLKQTKNNTYKRTYTSLRNAIIDKDSRCLQHHVETWGGVGGAYSREKQFQMSVVEQ